MGKQRALHGAMAGQREWGVPEEGEGLQGPQGLALFPVATAQAEFTCWARCRVLVHSTPNPVGCPQWTTLSPYITSKEKGLTAEGKGKDAR